MTAVLNVDTTATRRSVPLAGAESKISFELITPLHPRRSQVEASISQRFADAYGASIRHFMPLQLCACADGEIVATVGIRQAQSSALFLEHYFDRPIEQFAKDVLGIAIRRDEVVEIGNLVSRRRGTSQWLFIALTLLLCEIGRPWVTFTATPEVQKLLHRLGIEPQALTSADADRLGEDKSDWGNYYSQNPQVMITHAPTAKKNLMNDPAIARRLANMESEIRNLKTQWQTNDEDMHVRIA